DVVNSDQSWKCVRDNGHHPVPGYFFAATKGEFVDMNKIIQGDWKSASYKDNDWLNAAKVMDGKLKGMAWGIDWGLVPSSLPQMEMTNQRIPELRETTGMNMPEGFPKIAAAFTVPANSAVTLLLDQTYETNAYITLNFSGGKGAGISIGYAESLFMPNSTVSAKGNRNEIAGKKFIGRIDSLISNGDTGQSFTTLNFRTFRYIKLIIHTNEQPLTIADIYGTFTGYPFKLVSSFNSDQKDIRHILDIGWRTVRLNAWETYTDCPYYEQLQYIGDTRIQAMVSYFNTTDDRLARNAISLIDHSRLAEGITKSCYPTRGSQIIPPFSLWYIGMLHDYFRYRNDMSFVKAKLLGMRSVLEFFSHYQGPDGSLKDLPYWSFVDWSGNLWGEVKGTDGSAAIYDLQLLWALQCAAEMEASVGLGDYAKIYRADAELLKATIRRKYWDPKTSLFADTRDKKGFSQHVNALAILTGLVGKKDMPQVVNALGRNKKLTQCSVYFKYYLNQALLKGGYTDDYMDLIGIWKENIRMGLTTWAEYSDINTSRSDAHAWGSSPNVEFFRSVLGIDSDAPGFAKIKIEPHLGKLTHVDGLVPHPAGKIYVKYVKKAGKWNFEIRLPSKTPGILVWKGKSHLLRSNINRLWL
ncbi:MAG: alpha-rhamnosidase, partial [Mucilaginibacter sp.]|nr:alpha-rhamnosidase [Mucilaginibacter sp.]